MSRGRGVSNKPLERRKEVVQLIREARRPISIMDIHEQMNRARVGAPISRTAVINAVNAEVAGGSLKKDGFLYVPSYAG